MLENNPNCIEYEFHSDEITAKIIRSFKAKGNLKIQKSVKYQDQDYIITEINNRSFECNIHIYSLTFDDDSAISSICDFAFAFTALTRVSIPSSVRIIGNNAFSGCRTLKKIEFAPNSQLEKISQKSFKKTSIEKVALPSNISIIEDNAFFQCSKLKFIDLTNCIQLKMIGKEAFSTTPIETIFVPTTVEQIGERAFYKCNKLILIDLSKNLLLKKIENETFRDSNLSFISISPSIEQIGKLAFSNCKNLQTIEIPQNSELSQICEKAFSGASSLKSIYLPKKFKEFGVKWCEGLHKLNQITVSKENPNFCLNKDDKLLIGKFNEKSDKFDTIYFACRDIEKVEIPNYIEFIKEFSFFRCNRIKSLNFENDSNLRIIENESFSYAFSPFLDIKLPPEIRKIGFKAFDHSKIRELILSKCTKLKKIDENAFSMSTVVKVYFPVNLLKICSKAFFCCRNLHYLDFPENSKINYIDKLAFYYVTLYHLTVPANLYNAGMLANYKLISMEFLGESCFYERDFLIHFKVVSFPNAKVVKISLDKKPNDYLVFFIPKSAQILRY